MRRTHYSKSQFFVKKFNFYKTPSFSPQFFSWNQSYQQLKSPKPQHFHEFFNQKKIDNFLGKSKLNFWTKNEDFEQCLGKRPKNLGLPGLGGSFGALERSSDFAITELSSPPNGDSRLTRLKFSTEDFFLPLLSAS